LAALSFCGILLHVFLCAWISAFAVSGNQLLGEGKVGKAMTTDMDALQVRARELSVRRWGPIPLQDKAEGNAILAKLLEEAGELAGAISKHRGRLCSPEKTATLDDIREEIGDVLVVAIKMANHYDVIAYECARESLDKFESRLASAGL
jgi:NTP pyrophosphatase (non-canonical NTP hydrolase)